MSDLFDFYSAEARDQLTDFPPMAALRATALADFTRLGLPTRRDEDWKYSSTDGFNKLKFTGSAGVGSSTQAHPGDLFKRSFHDLPPGVIVQPWAEAWANHAEKIKPYLGKIATHHHGFQAQNTALFQEGYFIYIPEGVCLDAPLYLPYWQEGTHQARYIRTLMIAEPGSQAVIIEDYQGHELASCFTNTLTEVHLGQGASLKHYKIQRESRLTYHVGELVVHQTESSQLESHSLSVGGQWVRSDTRIALAGAHASCLMNGIYMTSDAQHVDHHTLVMHEVPDCKSEQDYKGMASGRSRAVFNGKVVVKPGAQHSDAKQQNKNLLLSMGAEIDTKPQLEIYADDVVCTHGATVGQLDEEALFYLEARAVPRDEARRLLIQAFVAENVQRLNLEPLERWMGDVLTQQVG
jgi:Fe-S cluster assembly protein SufD